MSNTVVGIFESLSEAQDAKTYLLANGFTDQEVDITTASSVDGNHELVQEDSTDRISNFFRNLFDDDEHEIKRYSEAGRRGTIVTVHTQSSVQAQTAAAILDNYGAVDFGETSGSYPAEDNTAIPPISEAGDDDTIKVIEEELLVGKREVTTGGIRLKSRIVERPVEETIRLRQEFVTLERTPVDRPATEADFDTFKEGTIEVIEHAEIPVVSKEARVVEEVSLGKQIIDTEEKISDTVRHTEVETENIENPDLRNHVENADLRTRDL